VQAAVLINQRQQFVFTLAAFALTFAPAAQKVNLIE